MAHTDTMSLTIAAAVNRAIELLRHENPPSNTFLGASGAHDKVFEIVITAYRQHTNFGYETVPEPSQTDVAARPAFYLLRALQYLNELSDGPAEIASIPTLTLEGNQITWTLLQSYYPNGVTEPAGTSQLEVEVGIVRDGEILFTGQRFYLPANGLAYTNSNILTGGPDDLITTRARFVDVNLSPISLWITTAAFPVTPGPYVPPPGSPIPPPEEPPFPDLGTAETYGVIASSTVTNTGPTTINGDLALSPGSAVVGAPTVTGTSNVTNGAAATAVSDANAAYLVLEALTGAVAVAGNIGGQTLTAGLYKSTSTLAVSSGDLTLTGPGTFIFQVASSLTFTSGRQVILAGGATADKVFWQVGSSATFGTTSLVKGTVIALASVTAQTGATIDGRLFALTGAVTLDTNVVTVI